MTARVAHRRPFRWYLIAGASLHSPTVLVIFHVGK